jgi:hypothetical protein
VPEKFKFFTKKGFAILRNVLNLPSQLVQRSFNLFNAKIAQLVERHLAKVEVAGSNPVFRSIPVQICSSGGIGRHAGLKILCPLGRAGSSPALSTEKSLTEMWGFFYLIFLFLYQTKKHTHGKIRNYNRQSGKTQIQPQSRERTNNFEQPRL